MEKYIKLNQIGKGCNGNKVVLVKNLEDNKVTVLSKSKKSYFLNHHILCRLTP